MLVEKEDKSGASRLWASVRVLLRCLSTFVWSRGCYSFLAEQLWQAPLTLCAECNFTNRQTTSTTTTKKTGQARRLSSWYSGHACLWLTGAGAVFLSSLSHVCLLKWRQSVTQQFHSGGFILWTPFFKFLSKEFHGSKPFVENSRFCGWLLV